MLTAGPGLIIPSNRSPARLPRCITSRSSPICNSSISNTPATMWIGNAIVFKTGGSILVADPRIITVGATNHIPAITAAVRHADRPAVLAFALHTDAHPDLLKALDAMGVSYQLARFPAEQGLDVLVVTPDRTLSPFDGNSLGAWFYGC